MSWKSGKRKSLPRDREHEIGSNISATEWNEPELAQLSPATTGYPLGVPPPNKILPKSKKKFGKGPLLAKSDEKDSTHITRRTSSRSQSPAVSNSQDEVSPSPDIQSESIKHIQDELTKNLKTRLSESLTIPSHIRSSLKTLNIPIPEYDPDMFERLTNIKSRDHPEFKRELELALEKKKRIRKSGADTIGSRNKRQKRLTEIQSRQESPALAGPSNSELAMANDDFCSTCGGLGRFLCCEGCPKSFHFSCVDPPLDEESLPESEWFCQECTYRKSNPKQYEGIFRSLFASLDRHNPFIYTLPESIKDRYSGVYANEGGEYRDLDVKVFKSTRSGFVEDQDMLRLTDKQGNPIFCYKCKGSTMTSTPIARCDYCSLSWHLDCLDPPLPTAKTVGTKWKCPNHADHLYHKRRRPKSSKVLDTGLYRGYKNNGNVEIIDSSDEETLNFKCQETLVHKHRRRIIKEPELIRLHETDTVKLDFLTPRESFNEYENEVHRTSLPGDAESLINNTETIMELDHLATKHKDERECVRSLCFLKYDTTNDIMTANTRSNLDILLETATKFCPPELQTTVIDAKNGHRIKHGKNLEEEYNPLSRFEPDFSEKAFEEVKNMSIKEMELLGKIRSLMKNKKQEDILKFLMTGLRSENQ